MITTCLRLRLLENGNAMKNKPYKYYITSEHTTGEVVTTNEIKLPSEFVKLSWPKKKIIVEALNEMTKLPPVHVV